MNKVIRDGNVAVLYSPGFGAGWYTWNREEPALIFDPVIVDMVEKRRHEDIPEYAEKMYLENGGYYGGASDLTIEWIPIGTRFTIEEYDGNESIRTYDDLSLIA